MDSDLIVSCWRINTTNVMNDYKLSVAEHRVEVTTVVNLKEKSYRKLMSMMCRISWKSEEKREKSVYNQLVFQNAQDVSEWLKTRCTYCINILLFQVSFKSSTG